MASEESEQGGQQRGVRRRHVLGGLLTSGALVAADTQQARASATETAAAPGSRRSAFAFGPDPLADHINDPDGAHAASAISFTPVGELGATEVQSGMRDLDQRVSGLLLFSPDFLQGHTLIYDDFFGTQVTSGAVGSQGWTVLTQSGGTLTAATVTSATAPGYYNLNTGTTAVGGSCVLSLDPFALSGAPEFVFETRVRLSNLNSGSHACSWRVGLNNGNGAAPTNGYYFEYTSADTSIHCRTAKAGARSDRDSNVTLAPITWYRLRIVSDGGGAISFYVDDALVATEANPAFIPSAADIYGPMLSIVKSLGTGTGGNRTLRVDYAYLLFAVNR